MDRFNVNEITSVEILVEENEIIDLCKQYENIIGKQICLNLIDVDNQKLIKLLKKTIDTGRDYLYRYINREIDFDNWLKEMLHYLVKKEGGIESEEIFEYILNFANEKKLYLRSTDEIYGIIHHLYLLILDSIYQNNCYDYSVIVKESQIKIFTEMSLDEMVENTFDDLWEPEQLQELYTIYDDVFEIIEVIVKGNRKISEDEKIELDQAISRVNALKDEMELQRSEYRNNDDVDYIWEYISDQLLMDYEFVKNHNRKRLSSRLSKLLSEMEVY